MAKYRGTGVVGSDDFKEVKYVGKTKSGKPITITLENAINMGNIDWSFAEKGDTVAQIVFTATYSNTDEAATGTEEPWTVETTETTGGAGAIILGVGLFQVGVTTVALTRGGGSFNVAREFRNINADGDRGPVKDRVVMDSSVATLTLNALEFITNLQNLYSGIATTT